jgi:hypothetical protein
MFCYFVYRCNDTTAPEGILFLGSQPDCALAPRANLLAFVSELTIPFVFEEGEADMVHQVLLNVPAFSPSSPIFFDKESREGRL